MAFDFGYTTETTEEVLKIVEKLKLTGYQKNFKRNSNRDYNHLQNFFIWKSKTSQEFLRICLISEGWHNERVFSWSVEFSFKPFRYKHNHRRGAKWKSEGFKGGEEEVYLNEFIKATKIIKSYLKILTKRKEKNLLKKSVERRLMK